MFVETLEVVGKAPALEEEEFPPLDGADDADEPDLAEEVFEEEEEDAVAEKLALRLAVGLAERSSQVEMKPRALGEARATADGGAIDGAPFRCALTWRRIALA